jgi:tetratricopeptide (TPR) repeat protein
MNHPPDARAQAVQAYRAARAIHPDFVPHATEVLHTLETLGQGGMGVVHRVRDSRLGREAALKLLLGDSLQPELVQRFRREASVTARLDHPSIPPVYEAGSTSSGQPFLLMKVIEGQPLSKAIEAQEGDCVPLLEALVKVGEAVAYAHSQRVLHRDLKPENVMVGRFGAVLVMDWGLARELDKPDVPMQGGPVAGGADLTQVGAVMGTPGYMPPEQAGGEEVDERADVFALGAILTEILTGAPPVTGSDSLNRVTRTITGKIEAPRDRDRGVPRDLDAIARRALAFERRDRTPSAEAFVADLRAYLKGEAVSCYRYGLRERLLRGARRRPGLAVGAVGLLVVVAIVVGLAGQIQSQRQALAFAGEQSAKDKELAAEREKAASARGREAEVRAKAIRGQAEAKERAAEEQSEALRRQENAVHVLLIGSQSAESGRRPDSAQIEKAIADYPSSMTFKLAYRAYSASKDYALAAAMLERQINDYPPAIEAVFDRLQLERAWHGFQAKVEPWERLLEERIRSNPEDPEARKLLLFKECQQAIHQPGGAAEAIRRLGVLLEEFPHYGGARMLRGVLRERGGDLEAALEDYYVAVRLENTRPEPFFRLGNVQHDLGRPRAAIIAYTQSLETDPRYLDALTNRALVRNQLGNHQGAIRDAEAAMKFDPKSYNAYTHRGNARRALGDYEGAIADHNKARAINPRNPAALANLANTYRSQGDLAKALELYTEMTRLLPRDHRPWLSRAIAFVNLKRYPEALADIERSIRIAPTRPQPLTQRGLIHFEQGQLEPAWRDYKAALQLDPKYSYAHIGLGRVLAAKGQHPAAIKEYDRALALRKKLAGAYGRRGQSLRVLGHKKRALRDLRRAVLEGTTHPARLEFLRELLTLEKELKTR